MNETIDSHEALARIRAISYMLSPKELEQEEQYYDTLFKTLRGGEYKK